MLLSADPRWHDNSSALISQPDSPCRLFLSPPYWSSSLYLLPPDWITTTIWYIAQHAHTNSTFIAQQNTPLTAMLHIAQHTLTNSTHISGMHHWECSAKLRQQSPEWTILSHVNCFVQGEVHWLQVLLGSLHPHSTFRRWAVFSSSPRGKLLRSAWHLIRLTFSQCGQTGSRHT